MGDKGIYDRGEHDFGGSLLILYSMVNVVKGIVHSQHVGFIHATVRIRTGRRIDVRAKLPIDHKLTSNPTYTIRCPLS